MSRPTVLSDIARVLAGAILVSALTSCEHLGQEVTAAAQQLPGFLSSPNGSEGYWRASGRTGAPKIVVQVGQQRAYFYSGKRLVGESVVSTGKRGFDTPPGHYRVIEKDRDHVSSEFGDYVNGVGQVVKANIDVRKDPLPEGTRFDGARMPYFLRFNGGYGMHAGYVPRFRASHGCIRLPMGMAKHFFENASEETPVIVKQ
jgi:hypothetical protein